MIPGGRREAPAAPSEVNKMQTVIASLTPGGVGVNQAVNVASLHDATNATAPRRGEASS
jgi:hypothetical protein